MKKIINKAEYISFIIAFAVYYSSFSREIMEIDWGEIVCCLYYFGIIHPTGYPLFTLLGWLFLKLPLGMSVAAQANLLSAIYGSIGILYFGKMLKVMSENEIEKEEKEKDVELRKGKKDLTVFFGIMTSSLALAFGMIYWRQAVAIEVYSLQMLLQNGTLYYAMRGYFEKEEKDKRYWIAAAAMLGLSFSNHLMTIYIVPGIIYLYITKKKLNVEAIKRLVILGGITTVIAIIFYGMLMMRARQNPLFNWGNPRDIESLIYHITGKQYRGFLFDDHKVFINNIFLLLTTVIKELGYIGAIGLIIGFANLKRENRAIFIWIAITLTISIIITCNYNIVDVDNYFLTTIVFSCVIFFYGLKEIKERYGGRIKAAYAIYLTPILLLMINYGENDFSSYTKLKEFAENVDKSIEPNSVVLLEKGDQYFCGYYYKKFIEGEYKQKYFVSLTLFWTPWYYDQIMRLHPELFNGIEKEFYHSQEKIAGYYQMRVSLDSAAYSLTVFRSKLFLKFLSEGKNVYVNKEAENLIDKKTLFLPENHFLVPSNFLYKVVIDTAYIPIDYSNYLWEFNKLSLNVENYLRVILPYYIADRLAYELNNKKYDESVILYENLKKYFPYFPVNKDAQAFIIRYKTRNENSR